MTTAAARSPQRRTAAARAGLLTVLLLVTAPSVATGAGAATAPTGSGSVTATTAPTPVATPDIIPLPNSGKAPETPGDRGGWQQQVLFFSICGAILVGIGLIWRESRTKRRRQGRLPTRSAKNGG